MAFNIKLHSALQTANWATGAIHDLEFYRSHGIDSVNQLAVARKWLAETTQSLDAYEAAESLRIQVAETGNV